MIAGGPALSRDEDGAAAAAVLSGLVLLAVLIAKWHSARGHEHQAQAARAAADHLNAAYTRHAAKPLAALAARGRRLPQPLRERQESAVQEALPADLAARVLSDTGWAALAATLAEAESAGRDTQALLNQAASSRELTSADSAAAMLIWRIRRDAHLRTTPMPVRASATRTRTALPLLPGAMAVSPSQPHSPIPSPKRVTR